MVPPPKNLMDEVMKQLATLQKVAGVARPNHPVMVDASMDLMKRDPFGSIAMNDPTGLNRLTDHYNTIMSEQAAAIDARQAARAKRRMLQDLGVEVEKEPKISEIYAQFRPRLDKLAELKSQELKKAGSTKNLPLPAMIAGLGLQGWEGTTPQGPPPPESLLGKLFEAINAPSRRVGETVAGATKEAGTAQREAWKKFLANPTAENSVDIAGDLIAPMAGSLRPIEAWHGSPVRGIEKFLREFIGSGEGNAAYGVGHYSAENPNVAKWYREMLSKAQGLSRFVQDGKDLSRIDMIEKYFTPGRMVQGYGGTDLVRNFRRTPDGDWAVEVISVNPKTGQPIYGEYPRIHRTEPEPRELRKFAKDVGIDEAEPGALYRVGIDADRSKMLDWQESIKNQPAAIQSVAKDLGVGLDNPGFFLYDRLSQVLDPSGRGSKAAGAARAAETLDQAGIPGVKYFDFNSRNKSPSGIRTRNFVTFDPERVKILEMLGLGGVTAGNLSKLLGEEKKNDSKRSKPRGG